VTWVKLDDQFFAHPKVIDLGKDAKLLYLAGLTYCSEHLTDGRISPAALRMVAAMVDVGRETAAELLEAGLWEAVDGAYQVHDYLDHQPTAETVRRKRDEARERMRSLRTGENTAECSPDVRANGAETSREVRRLEVEVDIDKELDVEEDAEEDAESARAPDGASVPDPVDWVFDYYREYVQPDARVCPRDKILTRLKRFTVDELTQGIENFAGDYWWMDKNRTRGAAWFFHSDARSEQFLTMEPRAAPDDKAPRRLHG
jgi:hypothetical protein